MNYTLRNLVVASLLMLLGIVAVISFIRGERQDLSRGKQEVQVFVAAKDIPASTSRGVEKFFDGKVFDPANPKKYLDSLEIKNIKSA